ncbi:MAG: hypothetical protein GQ548_03460 [Methylophaga sp.]|nr:hypothetical protein [Methylophaga sp.]
MAQDLLLKIDVTAKPSPMGENQGPDNFVEQETVDVQPFSSRLDEQIDKQSIKQNTVTESEQTEKKPVELDSLEQSEVVQLSVEVLTEGFDVENGNILPVSVDETIPVEMLTEEKVDTEAVELIISTDTTISKLPFVESAVLKPTSIDAAIPKARSQLDKIRGGESENKAHVITPENKFITKSQQAVETVNVDGEKNIVLKDLGSDQKKQSAVLRSDILNALTKTQDGETKTTAEPIIKTEKIMTAQLFDKSVNDARKIMDVANQGKTSELAGLKNIPERNVGGLVAAFTTAGSFSTPSAVMQSSVVGQPVLAMQPSMQSEAWGRVLSSRVVWMAREGVQQAELRLNPANLGPVEVKLHMNNEQVSVVFVAQHAATRDALEQALPRLRESFQENGMDLANADVSEQEHEQPDEEKNSEHSSSVVISNSDGPDVGLGADDDSIESDELELGVSVFA